jgi:polysaccharide export outer membrane protein
MDSDMSKIAAALTVATLVLVNAFPAGAQAPAATLVNQQATAPSPSRNVEYTVGSQDVLKITVFDEPTLSGSYRVDADGSVQYPMLGRVQAGGRMLRDIEADISKKLEDGFVRRAQVTIDVEQFRSRSIFIVGEVRSPGKYPLTGQTTVIEALASAGSTTANASSEILILRSRSADPSKPILLDAANQANITRISLTDLQLGRLSENINLQEGDTIFVPKAERFFVTGQVRSPGAYTHERGLTVLQAISLAGGLTEKGSNRRMKAIRTVNGKKAEVKIGLTDVVLPGDTLVIPQRLL